MATELAELGLKVDSDGFVRATSRMKDYERQGKKTETATQRMEKRAERLSRAMGDLGRAAKTAGRVIAAAAVAFAAISLRAFAQFDAAMTKSLAIMGDVSEALQKDMAEAARQMAKETTFSAEQAAESFFFLASAGLDARQSIAALPQVARFAQAGAFDMARATDLATDAQSALGLVSKDSARNLENLTRVTDVLVKANTIANASVEQFSESLTNKAGASMRQLNIEIESGVAVLAAWADQGIKGTLAGEQFNIVTRDLQTAARKNADEFERMNIAVFDSQGNFNNMSEIVGDLEAALDGMSVQQQGATLSVLGFQDQSVQAIRSLLGFSEAIARYEDALEGASGITEEVAQKQLTSFNAQLSLLRSRINDVFISIGQELAPVLLRASERFTEVKDGSSDLEDTFRSLGAITLRMGAGIVLVAEGFSTLGKSIAATAAIARASAPDFDLKDLIIPGRGLFKAADAVTDASNARTAILDALQEDIDRSREVTQALFNDLIAGAERLEAGAQAPLENTAGFVQRIITQMNDLAKNAAFDVLRQMADASGGGGSGGGNIGTIKGAAEATAGWLGFVEDLRAELGGPLDVALREFVAKAEEVRVDLEAGRIDGELYAEVIKVLREQFVATRREIKTKELEAFNDELDAAAAAQRAFSIENERMAAQLEGPAAEAALDFRLGIEEAMAALAAGETTMGDFLRRLELLGAQFEATGNAASIFGDIGAGFAQSIFQGQGLQSALSSALIGVGGQKIGNALEGVFKTAAEDGLGAAFKSEGFKRNSAEGFALALGQAIEGNIGQAAFTAAGNAIAGPVGSAIGSIIGGLVFGDKVPKFQARGTRATRATDAGTDLTLDTRFGSFELAFRELSDEQKRAVTESFTGFFNFVGDLTKNLATDQQERIADAVQRFGISSRSGPDSPEGQLKLLLDDIIGTFPPFFGELVRAEATLDEQLAKFADLLTLENIVTTGRGIGGLGFEELAVFLDEAAMAGESLTDALDRIRIGFDALNRLGQLTGNALRDTSLGLADLADDLTRLFGDAGAQAIASRFDRIFSTFFTEEENLEATMLSSGSRGEELLRQLLEGIDGIDFSEEFLTRTGFADLLRTLTDMELDAEQLALLSEAGIAIADLIEAEEQLAKIRGESTDAAARAKEVEDFLRTVGEQALQVLSPTRIAFIELQERLAENARRAKELELNERQLGIVRASAEAQIQGFVLALSESIPQTRDALFGAADAADDFGSSASRAVNNMRDAWLAAIESIRDALDDQLLGDDTSLTNRERLVEAERQLSEAIAAANAGDLDAAQSIPKLFRQTIGLGADFFDTSTQEFADFEARIRAMTEGVTTSITVPPDQQTARNTSEIARRAESVEKTGFERLQLATQLVDQIAIMSRLTEKSPSEIGREFGIPIQDLIEIMTGEVPDLTGDALASHFDDLVNETAAQLDEFARIEAANQATTTAVGRSNQLLKQILDAVSSTPTQSADADVVGTGTAGGAGSFTKDSGSLTAFADGGPVTRTEPALVHSGEFVVPRGGTLVSSDPGMIRAMAEVQAELAQFRRDFRQGVELTVNPLESIETVEKERLTLARRQASRDARKGSRELGRTT